MSKPYDEAWRTLDSELLAAEAELAREKEWLQHDFEHEDILMGWVHDIIDSKDVAEYIPPEAA